MMAGALPDKPKLFDIGTILDSWTQPGGEITQADVQVQGDKQFDALDALMLPKQMDVLQSGAADTINSVQRVEKIRTQLRQTENAITAGADEITRRSRVPKALRKLIVPFDSSFSVQQAKREQQKNVLTREMLRQSLDDETQAAALRARLTTQQSSMLQLVDKQRRADIQRSIDAQLAAVEAGVALQKLGMEHERLGMDRGRFKMETERFDVDMLMKSIENGSVQDLQSLANRGIMVGAVKKELLRREQLDIATKLSRINLVKENREHQNSTMKLMTEDQIKEAAVKQDDGSFLIQGLGFTRTEKQLTDDILFARNWRRDVTKAETQISVDRQKAASDITVTRNIVRRAASVNAGVPPIKLEGIADRLEAAEHFLANGVTDEAVKLTDETKTELNEVIKTGIEQTYSDKPNRAVAHARIFQETPSGDDMNAVLLPAAFDRSAMSRIPGNRELDDAWRATVNNIISLTDTIESGGLGKLTAEGEANREDISLLLKSIKDLDQLFNEALSMKDENGNTPFEILKMGRNSNYQQIALQSAQSVGLVPKDITFDNNPDNINPDTGTFSLALALVNMRKRYDFEVEKGIIDPNVQPVPYDEAYLQELRRPEVLKMVEQQYSFDNMTNEGFVFAKKLFGDNVLVDIEDFHASVVKSYADRKRLNVLGEDLTSLMKRKSEIVKAIRRENTGVSIKPLSKREFDKLIMEFESVDDAISDLLTKQAQIRGNK